jgi:hypothetical protein
LPETSISLSKIRFTVAVRLGMAYAIAQTI